MSDPFDRLPPENASGSFDPQCSPWNNNCNSKGTLVWSELESRGLPFDTVKDKGQYREEARYQDSSQTVSCTEGAARAEKGRTCLIGGHPTLSSLLGLGKRLLPPLEFPYRHPKRKGHSLENVYEVKNEGLEFDATASDEIRPKVARAIIDAGYDLMEFRPVGVRLEDIFLQLTRDEPEPPEMVEEGETESGDAPS